MYDVVVIGAGVVGGFVARQLSRYKLRIALLEKNTDVCCGATKANSAIVHSGYSGKPGSIKAGMTTNANRDFANVCEELDVRFSRIGSLLVASDEGGMQKLYERYDRGLQNGVEGLCIISSDEARRMEPHLNPSIKLAMYAPTTGIVNPWEFGLAAVENAVDNGVELFCECFVRMITKENNQFHVNTNQGVFQTKYIVNCAGAYSDKIHNMVAKPSFRIAPRRGEYFVLDKSAEGYVRHVIFQARDNEENKGVIVLPTVNGNILVGPSTEDLADAEDVRTTEKKLCHVREVASDSIVGLPFTKVIRSFAGIRPRPQLLKCDPISGEMVFSEDKVKDFIIGETPDVENFFDCAGIKSPGLTCANEIGKFITDLICKKENNTLPKNAAFSLKRRRLARFALCSIEKKADLIRENPLYGHIVCRCEQVTEGEIVDAIHRNAGARTVDGVKRRTGCGLGRCQGGFCQPTVINILARELGCRPEDIRRDEAGSEYITHQLFD